MVKLHKNYLIVFLSLFIVFTISVVSAGTTIQLQDADTENLNDAYFGWNAVGGGYSRNIVIMFDLSQIPDGSTITNASLNLYVEEVSTTWSNATFYVLNNNTWDEQDSDLHNLLDYVINSTSPGLTNIVGWQSVDNLTAVVQQEFDKGGDKISFLIGRGSGCCYPASYDVADLIIGRVGDYEDYINIRSKEDSNFSTRPYLNISYESATYTITLDSPSNSDTRSSPLDFSGTFNSTEKAWVNVTLQIWNSTGDLYNSSFQNITGTDNSTTFSSISFSDDGVYTWNILGISNDSVAHYAQSNYTLTISTGSPIVSLQSPSNKKVFDSTTNQNIFFNFTSYDSDGLDTCQLWGNWTGIWHNNYSWVNPSSGVMNWTNLTIDSEGIYTWNILCNDTIGNEGYASLNRTFIVDKSSPIINITSISTSAGSQTITFQTSYDDISSTICKYTIFDSAGSVDGLNNNVTFSCGSLTYATVTGYASYNLSVLITDSVGNTNTDLMEFTTSPTTPGGGGGGTTTPTEKIPAIGLKEITGTRDYDELERMIIYAKINSFCSSIKEDLPLAIQDFSGRCSLTIKDLLNISQEMIYLGVTVPQEDMILFFDKYSKRELFQGFATEDQIKEYGLFTSVLGIVNPLTIYPASLDKPFIISQSKGNKTISYIFLANKNIKECTVTSETKDIVCSLISNTTFRVSYNIQDVKFFDKIFRGSVSVTSDAPQESLEVKSVPLTFRVYNLAGSKWGIPILLWIFGILFMILVSSILLLTNKRFKGFLSRRKG